MSSKLPSNEERKFRDNADSIQALLEGGMSISEAINKAQDEAEDCDDVGGGLIKWAVGNDVKKLDKNLIVNYLYCTRRTAHFWLLGS